MSNIDFIKTENKTFEIVVYQRDFLGNLTNNKVSHSSDSAHDIWTFFERSTQKPKKKNKSE